MFVMGNVLQGVATILDTVLWLYMWVIIARALISLGESRPLESDCPVFGTGDRAGIGSDSALGRMEDGHRSVTDHRHSDHRFFADCTGEDDQRPRASDELSCSRGTS